MDPSWLLQKKIDASFGPYQRMYRNGISPNIDQAIRLAYTGAWYNPHPFNNVGMYVWINGIFKIISYLLSDAYTRGSQVLDRPYIYHLMSLSLSHYIFQLWRQSISLFYSPSPNATKKPFLWLFQLHQNQKVVLKIRLLILLVGKEGFVHLHNSFPPIGLGLFANTVRPQTGDLSVLFWYVY